MQDIEDITTSFLTNKPNKNKLSDKMAKKYTTEQYNKIEQIVLDFLTDDMLNFTNTNITYKTTELFLSTMMKRHKITPRKEEILYVYRRMIAENKITSDHPRGKLLTQSFKKKDMRETSGVMVFAILSSPYPEVGKFIKMRNKFSEETNVIYIKDNGFINIEDSIEGSTEVHIDRKGLVVGIYPPSSSPPSVISPPPTISYLDRIINNKEYRKTIDISIGTNLSNLVNPLTGELRQSFSCPFNCYFCPSQPGMPKSYEDKEPAVARSLRNGWSAILSMRERFEQYVANGMEVDKLEVIVKGGTWTSYNSYYRKKFCRDIFYTANTFWDSLDTIREPLTLIEEQKINETAQAHVIGITVETRPDYITGENLIEFRECGITRLELGFQHTDNKILRKVNRQHKIEDSIRGIAKLLSCGFKVDIHLMPGLPGSSYDIDLNMVKDVLSNPKYQVDQLKWYPTIVTPYTVINDWYEKGKYKPWVEDEELLLKLTLEFKKYLNPWNRTNRIQRDFTKDFICGGSHRSNLGDMVKSELKKKGIKCKCIRCREIKNMKLENSESIGLIVRKFDSYSYSDTNNNEMATEYFISYETKNHILGFIRLRLDPNAGIGIFSELKDCAMIRELHVYGKMETVNSFSSSVNNTRKIQHIGLGTKLVNKAKEIAKDNGYSKISVIAGVGVRNYYRNKHNFHDGKYYLLCDI